MGQNRFSVTLWGRKCECYLMKGYVKDFTNSLDSNCESVPSRIVRVLV